MSTIADILNMRASDIKPPEALPQGVYLGVVDGPFREVKSKDKGTPGFEFTIRLVSPINVADTERLAQAGGCQGKTVRHTLYVTDNSTYFLKQFLTDHLCIPDPQGDKTIAQLMSEAPNQQVGIVLDNTVSKGTDPRMIHIVKGTVKP